MSIIIGGTTGITFPDTANLPAANVTSVHGPFVTDTSNIVKISNGVRFSGTTGLTYQDVSRGTTPISYVVVANGGLRNDTTGVGASNAYSYTIPTGVTQITINAVGGGGPGYSYHDGGYGEHAIMGAPGAGVQSLVIRVQAGDVISGNVGGGGGSGFYNGTDNPGIGGAGAATTIKYNGTLICTCGAGGVTSTVGVTTLVNIITINDKITTGTAVQGIAATTMMNTVDGYPYAYNAWGYIEGNGYPETAPYVGVRALTPPTGISARAGLGQYPGWIQITA